MDRPIKLRDAIKAMKKVKTHCTDFLKALRDAADSESLKDAATVCIRRESKQLFKLTAFRANAEIEEVENKCERMNHVESGTEGQLRRECGLQ